MNLLMYDEENKYVDLLVPNAFDIIADGIGVICGSISTHFLRKKVHD